MRDHRGRTVRGPGWLRRRGTGVHALTALLATIALAGALAACASSGGTGLSAQQLTVFAAASLRVPFTALGKQFEAAHPGSSVRFNFAGSSDLVAQLQQGAPADIFASADTTNMDKAAAAGLLSGSPRDFATNSMMIAVPASNPAHIGALADLAKPGVRVVVCAPRVPCGSAAAGVEEKASLTIKPVSEESSVTDVLGKVTTGEADAGLVYVSDVKSSEGKAVGIPIPTAVNVTNSYPIALLAEGADSALATEFEQLVLSPTGQQVLASAGFGPV